MMNYIGYLDRIDSDFLYGWASSDKFEQIKIKVGFNGESTSDGEAVIYREDLKLAGIGNGAHGFKVKLPVEVKKNKRIHVVIKPENDESLIISEKEFDIVNGKIERFNSNKVYGWVSSDCYEVQPHITVNGLPCHIESLKANGTRLEFIAEIPPLEYSFSEFKLECISLKSTYTVDSKKIHIGSLVPNNLSSINEALEVAKKDGAVAIVVWEGTHNPIGRAQVLYNVIKDNRPAIIIAFDLGFSDEPIWKPMANSDAKVLVLPWSQREFYSDLLKKLGITFDLVWICKPRLPAFELAKMVSHKNTRYLIDLDDNEIEMSSSDAAKEKPYGLLSAKIAEQFIRQVPTRSVASCTLKNDFNGEFIRHARTKRNAFRNRETDLSKEIRVGFIGTVRPHKGVVEAAKAIKLINEQKGYKIKFVVGGIYNPESLRSQLISLGCEVHGHIDSARLNYHLQGLDVVITGFPDEKSNKEILKYQISSKIGDGLCNQRPVLVPEGVSVSDLHQIPGVFIFNSINFTRILENAIGYPDEIDMHEQFTIDWNYNQFKKLEKRAVIESPTGQQLFNISRDIEIKEANDRHILLVWKQQDTGLYGRRVDHIARSFTNSGCKVTCLEICTESNFKDHYNRSVRIDSDNRFIVEDYHKKKSGFEKEGIYYKSITEDASQTVESALNRLLIERHMMPTNTVVIMFPIVPNWVEISKTLHGYNLVCDMVDNQLSWEKKKPLELLKQYKYLFDRSSKVIFNSEENRNYFNNLALLDKNKTSVIPNWYLLPSSYEKNIKSHKIITRDDSLDLVYSGNMNDRFDWDTVFRIPKEVNRQVRIHLIGNCQRAYEKMTYILDEPSIVYHGPMREIELLEFMKRCDLAIMPHIHDEVSSFMNPMKVNMYQEIGLPCITSKVQGVDFDIGNILLAEDSDDFIRLVDSFDSSSCKFESDFKNISHGKDYVDIVLN